MKVLSLFDGMSCGQLALKKAGIGVSQYYASEVDKNAIKVAMSNFPSTIQLGDVTKIKSSDLHDIDLLIGGSPCQGFSLAGKQLNFEDSRSKLFFEYVRLLKELKPKYFLLENVKMKREYQDIITEYLNVEPILINSALVSAHDRKRLYWTNIPNVQQPENKGVALKDILKPSSIDLFIDNTIADRYIKCVNPKFIKDKSCVIGKLSSYQGDRVFDINGKASSLSASGGNNGGGSCNLIIDPEYKTLRKLSVVECELLQTVPEGYTNKVKKTQRYKMLGNGWTVDVIAFIFKNLELKG